MLIYSYYPIENIKKPIHRIIFEIEKNPYENPTFENTLKEPFEERGIKGELDPIPQRLMNILW